MRILVVEDEAALRDQISAGLRDLGYAVDTADDGQEALFQGSEYPLDLAVVDLGLPRLSGLEVIRSWREAGKTFPVLILTARGRWQEKVEGLEAGADDYLVKPFPHGRAAGQTAGAGATQRRLGAVAACAATRCRWTPPGKPSASPISRVELTAYE